MDLSLKNHVAVVFGAASGIGEAIAKAFAAEGAFVGWFDRDPRVLTVAGDSPRNRAQVVDVTDAAQVENLLVPVRWRSGIERHVAGLGSVRHVVFAAGCGSGKVGFPFWQLSPQDWPRVLAVNLLGAVNVAHTFGPLLAERKAGTMLFISSVAGQIGSQTDPPYSAAKAALINFAQVAAKDLAPHNVRVNVISPGMVQTPLNRSVWQAWNERQTPEEQLSYDAWAEAKIKQIAPLGRWQTAEEVASLAVFLASERACNITGQTLNVDGGQVMHS